MYIYLSLSFYDFRLYFQRVADKQTNRAENKKQKNENENKSK